MKILNIKSALGQLAAGLKLVAIFIGILATGSLFPAAIVAQDIKISDPASVVVIVNRDSNDISFMDIKSHRIIGSVFLGKNEIGRAHV